MVDEAYRPYQDPELVEEAHGDPHLLDRLVARKIAQIAVEEAGPAEREGAESWAEVMDMEVQLYRIEHPRPGNIPSAPE